MRMLAEMRYNFGPLWIVLTDVEWNFCLVCAPYSHFLRQPNSYRRQTFHCRDVEFPENSVVYLALARLRFR